MSYIFDGKDITGLSHQARAFYFDCKINSGSSWQEQGVVVEVDQTSPTINVTNPANIISPFQSSGILDSLSMVINASKFGTASLSVQSNDTVFTGISDITNGQNYCYTPTICGNGNTLYAFYSQFDGTYHQILVTKSLDGGISWTTPYIIATYNQQISSVNAACTGNEVICWATVNGNTEYLLFSVDGGTTFTTFSVDITNTCSESDK